MKKNKLANKKRVTQNINTQIKELEARFIPGHYFQDPVSQAISDLLYAVKFLLDDKEGKKEIKSEVKKLATNNHPQEGEQQERK